MAAHACCLVRLAIMPSSIPALKSSTPRMEAAGWLLAIFASHVLRNCANGASPDGPSSRQIRLICAFPCVISFARAMGT